MKHLLPPIITLTSSVWAASASHHTKINVLETTHISAKLLLPRRGQKGCSAGIVPLVRDIEATPRSQAPRSPPVPIHLWPSLSLLSYSQLRAETRPQSYWCATCLLFSVYVFQLEVNQFTGSLHIILPASSLWLRTNARSSLHSVVQEIRHPHSLLFPGCMLSHD